MKSYTMEQELKRAQEARSILNSSLFDETFNARRDALVKQSIEAAKLDDREAARMKVLALQDLRGEFEHIATNGDFAEEAARRAK